MRNLPRRIFFAVVLSMMATVAVSAETYPAKPLRIIVPFPPGGASDVLARVVATGLGKSLGQSVIVDNRPGAGTIIGSELVAKSAPDGYTLLWLTTPSAINVTLRKSLPFDTVHSFVPIVIVASIPLALMVKPSLPVKDLAQFVSYAKAHPGTLNYGSSGTGGGPHLAMELLKSTAGLSLTHVPYQGTAPALTALLGGHVDVVMDTVQASAPLILTGKVRGLATTGLARSSLLPEVPTFEQAGMANYHSFSWFGLAAPAGTPSSTIDRINAAVVKLLGEASVKRTLEQQGFQLIGNSPQQASAFFVDEIAKWSRVVISAGARESQ